MLTRFIIFNAMRNEYEVAQNFTFLAAFKEYEHARQFAAAPALVKSLAGLAQACVEGNLADGPFKDALQTLGEATGFDLLSKPDAWMDVPIKKLAGLE